MTPSSDLQYTAAELLADPFRTIPAACAFIRWRYGIQGEPQRMILSRSGGELVAWQMFFPPRMPPGRRRLNRLRRLLRAAPLAPLEVDVMGINGRRILTIGRKAMILGPGAMPALTGNEAIDSWACYERAGSRGGWRLVTSDGAPFAIGAGTVLPLAA